jgi:hypothetical protein
MLVVTMVMILSGFRTLFWNYSAWRGCAAFCLVAALGVGGAVASSEAGTLVNRDRKPYKYSIFWDDLSVPVKGDIGPMEKVFFPDKAATIELVGKRDNIYVRAQESVYILNGVMRRH